MTGTAGVHIVSLQIGKSLICLLAVVNVGFVSTMKEGKTQIKRRRKVPRQFIFLMCDCEKTDRDIDGDETEETDLESIHRLKP